jgi:hypothetical protein
MFFYKTILLYLVFFFSLRASLYSQEKWVEKYDADWTHILADDDFHYFREFQATNSFTSLFTGFNTDSIRVETGFIKNGQLHRHKHTSSN